MYIFIYIMCILCVFVCVRIRRDVVAAEPDELRMFAVRASPLSAPRVTFTPEHSHVLRNNWSTTIWFSAWLSSYWAFWMTAMVYTWMDGGRDGWLSSFYRCSIEEDKHLTRIKTLKDLNEADTLRQENISRHRTCHRIIKSFFFKELWSSEPQMLRLPA